MVMRRKKKHNGLTAYYYTYAIFQNNFTCKIFKFVFDSVIFNLIFRYATSGTWQRF